MALHQKKNKINKNEEFAQICLNPVELVRGWRHPVCLSPAGPQWYPNWYTQWYPNAPKRVKGVDHSRVGRTKQTEISEE